MCYPIYRIRRFATWSALLYRLRCVHLSSWYQRKCFSRNGVAYFGALKICTCNIPPNSYFIWENLNYILNRTRTFIYLKCSRQLSFFNGIIKMSWQIIIIHLNVISITLTLIKKKKKNLDLIEIQGIVFLSAKVK